jgi:hypothetical protein
VVALLALRARTILRRDTLAVGLLTVLVAFLLVHFCVFPADNDRMLIGAYIVVGVTSVGSLMSRYADRLPLRVRSLVSAPTPAQSETW